MYEQPASETDLAVCTESNPLDTFVNIHYHT